MPTRSFSKVSEGLSSMEIEIHNRGAGSFEERFQKDLVVWKSLCLIAPLSCFIFLFQKDLVVWKSREYPSDAK